jgi:hypothetical protein
MGLKINKPAGWVSAAEIAKTEAVTPAPAPAPVAAAPAVKKETPVSKPEPAAPKKTVIASAGGELATLLKQLRKDKGEQSIIKGSEQPDVPRLATGLFEFDFATGGGFPKGRYSIIYGPESSGKTNACYAAVANAQKQPPPCNKAGRHL